MSAQTTTIRLCGPHLSYRNETKDLIPQPRTDSRSAVLMTVCVRQVADFAKYLHDNANLQPEPLGGLSAWRASSADWTSPMNRVLATTAFLKKLNNLLEK
jgi:hypothetical protein